MNNNSPSDNKQNLAYTSLTQGRSGGVGGTTLVAPLNRAPGAPVQGTPGGTDQPLNGQTTMAIAKELLETGKYVCSGLLGEAVLVGRPRPIF